MSNTLQLIESVLRRGEVVMRERPDFENRSEILRVLEAAYGEFRMNLAGPMLAFDAEAALAGARFLLDACWLLVSSQAEPASTHSAIELKPSPSRPESHLSGDLCLRHLTTVYRRVRIRPPDDFLHRAVVEALRRWPLSGAASEVSEEPLGDVQFSNHYGLQLLYAERLAANLRTAWIPKSGRTREALELVLQQQGKSLPAESSSLES